MLDKRTAYLSGTPVGETEDTGLSNDVEIRLVVAAVISYPPSNRTSPALQVALENWRLGASFPGTK